MRLSESKLLILLAFISALFVLACASDSSDTNDINITDGDVSENEQNQDCPPGLVWDNGKSDCIDPNSTCPPGMVWNATMGACGLPDKSCPPGLVWSDDKMGCITPSAVDGDEDTTEKPAPKTCRDSFDCPYEKSCGADSTCSVWGVGSVSGSVEASLFNKLSGNFASPGIVKGKYRGEGIIIGQGADSYIRNDSKIGPVLQATVCDILASDLNNCFTFYVKKDLVKPNTTLDFDSETMGGFYHLLDIGFMGAIDKLEIKAQAWAGKIHFSHVNIVNDSTGRFNADFSLFLGPALEKPEGLFTSN